MADNDVFHRRNKQIQDAIEGQNMKQALNLIEKRMKKGEDTVFLKAWRANILSYHTDSAHRLRGLAESLELCEREPAITDIEAIDILHQTLSKEDGKEEALRKLWERAAKAKSQDRKLQMKWFSYAFESDDWKSAQKAAMSLQNNFPRERKFHFWAIFLSYLIAVDPSSSDADRKLFGMLAYRMISKAAENVPSDPKQLLSAPRAIQTPEEVILLTKIFESQGRHAEIAKILDTENVGLNSPIIQNDWNFVGLKLAGLENASMWSEGLAYAKSLLTIPGDEAGREALQAHDDWAVWTMLISATENINDPKTTTEVQDFIKDFINFLPKSRNAQLAQLELISWGVQSGKLETKQLFAACKEYLDRNKARLYTFADLGRYVPALDKTLLSEFIEYQLKCLSEENEAQGPFRGVAKINALKVEYCFQLASDESNVSKQRVEDFLSRCLRAYRETERPEQSASSSAIESQPSDDLLVLASMCLIRFSGLWADGNEENTRDMTLIRAGAILERLLLDSPHNYHALLLLVRIYLLLGAGSLALSTFSKLSVKHMQFETVAHNLFTRLATIHPHSAPPVDGAEYKDFEPQSALVHALYFYRNAAITTNKNRDKGLDLGAYANLEGTIILQKRLNESICQRMWALEVRRMQRLAGGESMNRYEELAQDESPMLDQREFTAFMNCEPQGTPKFEERMRVGPLPKGRWMVSSRTTDHLFSILRSIALQKPTSRDIDPPNPDEFTGPAPSSEMTAAEIEGAKINMNLLKVALFMNGSKSVTSAEVDSSLAQVEEHLGSKLKALALENGVSQTMSKTTICLRPGKPSAPSWRYLHEMYITVESVKAASHMAALALKKGSKAVKVPKDRMERLGGLARQIYESIRENTRTLKSHISESGMLGNLTELVLAGLGSGDEGKELRTELEKTLDLPALEVFCGSLMESWEEGLEGVMGISL